MFKKTQIEIIKFDSLNSIATATEGGGEGGGEGGFES